MLHSCQKRGKILRTEALTTFEQQAVLSKTQWQETDAAFLGANTDERIWFRELID